MQNCVTSKSVLYVIRGYVHLNLLNLFIFLVPVVGVMVILRMSTLKKKFPHTNSLGNSLLKECFVSTFNLNCLESSFNRYFHVWGSFTFAFLYAFFLSHSFLCLCYSTLCEVSQIFLKRKILKCNRSSAVPALAKTTI